MSTHSHSPVSLQSFAELPSSIGSPSDSSPYTSPDSYNGLKIAREKRVNVQARDESYRNATAVSMLPDNILLEIFDRYRKDQQEWHILVHNCRRWRQITFASPRYLDLQILCRDGTPVRKYLGIWPAFPIVVQYGSSQRDIAPNDEDNVIAALEHPDRVCHVQLHVTESNFGKIAAVMQEPFPVLTRLSISADGDVPVIPSGFLGGSAPCLQIIELHGIPFPALPTLLLSTNDLVELNFWRIPPYGGLHSPEAMVAGLAALPRLVYFRLGYQDTSPQPDRMHPPSVTRTVLPALNHFTFSGECGFLENFVARIDAPQLRCFEIIYWDTDVVDVFETPQLCSFINRSENLKRSISRHCKLELCPSFAEFSIACTPGHISVRVVIEETDCQIAQISHAISLGWISPILSDIVHFSISCITVDHGGFMDDLDTIWVRLLHQFPSVQTLFMSSKIAGRLSPVLEYAEGILGSNVMVTQVLPSLDLLCLEDQPVSSVGDFITVFQDSEQPVTVVTTQREFDDRLKSYP